MLLNTRLVAAAVTLVALLPACVSADKYYAQQDELAELMNELDGTRSALMAAEDTIMSMEDERFSLMSEADRAARLQAEVDQLRTQLDNVTIPSGTELVNNAAEGLYGYRVSGDLLFPVGSDKITAEGEKVLKEVAAALNEHSLEVRIDGHTDSDPVVKTKEKWPAGNIQLAAARAIAVREALVKFGVDPKRMFVASFAENRPATPGNNSQAKQRNRRVEIMVKYDVGPSS